MSEVCIIGVDLSKAVFQLHGAGRDGEVLFRKKLSRPQFVKFIEKQPKCIVAMEACGSSHHWGRFLEAHGFEVRLIPPKYVKAFVKRHKNDAADAEAIAEAAARPTMRFVAVKSEEQQAQAMAYRMRDMLVRQRTQLVNALRGHLAEFGLVGAKGLLHVGKLVAAMDAPESGVPDAVRKMAQVQIDQIEALSAMIEEQDRTLRKMTADDEKTALLRTIPGIGPITAAAVEAFAPPLETFQRGRDFAAWLGLVPRQYSTAGKERMGHVSKQGQSDIRRLLIIGAMAVIRWEKRRGTDANPWIKRLLERKPLLVAAVALANKMARMVWAVDTKREAYKPWVAA